MKYLQEFLDAYTGSGSLSDRHFDHAVIQDVEKDRKELVEQNTILVFEPITVQEEKIVEGDRIIYKYSGKFLYDTVTDGISLAHREDPYATGDPQKTQGELLFILDLETGKVESVSENIASCSWGKKHDVAHKQRVISGLRRKEGKETSWWKIITPLFLLLLLIGIDTDVVFASIFFGMLLCGVLFAKLILYLASKPSQKK